MNRLLFSLFCLLASQGGFAIGLGDLNKQPVLGERLDVELAITGAGKGGLDASCFHLKQPNSGDDIPWVKSAVLSIRKGVPPVLEIRTHQFIHEPILALSVHVACGHEMVRDYVLLASPARDRLSEPVTAARRIELPASVSAEQVQTGAQDSPVVATSSVLPSRSKQEVARALAEKPVKEKPVESRSGSNRSMSSSIASPRAKRSDRLLLSAGGEVGDPALHLSVEINSLNERISRIDENQREMMRLEFRMLQALQEQALTQMEATEKLRKMDKALVDLQQASVVQPKPEPVIPAQPPPAALPVPSPQPQITVPAVTEPVSDELSLLEEWWLELTVLVLTLVGGGLFGWKYGYFRREPSGGGEYVSLQPVTDLDDPAIDQDILSVGLVAKSSAVAEPEVTADDLPVELISSDMPIMPGGLTDELTSISLDDLPFDPGPVDLSFDAPAVNERQDVNPVMELADVMLSFGRVKGAAQTLQEFIDANPQVDLQPWVRLLEVYRMAGMRHEFEEVALKLNKNFNVAVQHWDDLEMVSPVDNSIDFVLDDSPADGSSVYRPEHIEDMPHICQLIVAQWSNPDFSEFVYQLLRDTRGGSRSGFSMGVVEEMLFLISLKQTIRQMKD